MHSFEFTQLNPSMAWKVLWQYFTPTKTSCRNSMFASILTFLSYISSLTMFSLSYCLVLQMASTVNFQNGYTSTSLKKCIVLVTSATMKNKWPYGSSTRRQSSCMVPTSTGCWNSLSWHQPIPHVVSMDITRTQTQRWKGQMLSLSMHFPSSLSKKTVYILAKMPAYPQQSIQHLVTAHGATMFLPALKLFLRNHMLHTIIIPGLQDHFDIFWQVVITALPNPLVSESPRQWRVRATPEVPPGHGQKPGSPTKFDMALTSNGIRTRTLEGEWLFVGLSKNSFWYFTRYASGTGLHYFHSASSIWDLLPSFSLHWVVHTTQGARPLIWPAPGLTFDSLIAPECSCDTCRWNHLSLPSYSEDGTSCWPWMD